MNSEQTAHRLHPLAIISFAWQPLRFLAVPLIVAALPNWRQALKPSVLPWTVTITVALLVFFVLLGYWRYCRFSYQLLPAEIVVRHGFWLQKVDHIPYGHIQNVSAKQWFYLRPFAVESVQIETAGTGGEPEISLAAVPLTLRSELAIHRQMAVAGLAEASTMDVTPAVLKSEEQPITGSQPAAGDQSPIIFQLGGRRLLLFALTSGRTWWLFFGLVGVSSQVVDQLFRELWPRWFGAFWDAPILQQVVIVILAVVFLFVGAMIGIVLRYAGFVVRASATRLQLQSGLLQVQRVNLTRSRVQAVLVEQSGIQQLCHLASIRLLVAATAGENEPDGQVVLVPLIKQAAVANFLAQTFPELAVPLTPPAPVTGRVYFYRLRNCLLLLIPLNVGGGLLASQWPWLWLGLLALDLFMLFSAMMAAKRTQAQVLTSRLCWFQTNKVWTRQQYWLRHSAVQSLITRRSRWLAKAGFGHLQFDMATNDLQLRYLPAKELAAIRQWYLTLPAAETDHAQS